MNLRWNLTGWLIVLTVFIAGNRSMAQESTEQKKPQAQERSLSEIVNKPVVWRVPGMEKVTVKANLKYTTVNDPNLLMDVYLPPGLKKGERRPAVLFIHGGVGAEYKAKDWGIYKSWGRLVAASGLIGVTFTHRLGYPNPHLADAAADVEAALSYLRAHADELSLEKDSLGLAAYSAGGPLLSLALRDKPAYIRCLVSVYAFLDIQQSEMHKPHETPAMLKSFSPLTFLTGDASSLPPLFIARAGRDVVPGMNDSIDRFIQEALARNAPITVANYPTGVHGFDNQNDDERSREIIKGILAFLKTHLGLKEDTR